MKEINLHLIISTLIVVPAGLYYGFGINFIFSQFVEIRGITTDVSSIYKAIMGLYLAFASLWILGIFKKDFYIIATITNILFMLGLVLGRIISIIFDGIPSTIFILGTIGELVLGFYGWYQLKIFKSISKPQRFEKNL